MPSSFVPQCIGNEGEFFATIEWIAQAECPVPDKSPLVHELSAEAASANANILRSYDNDLGKLIEAHQSSTLGYGSELRPMSQLEPLLR